MPEEPKPRVLFLSYHLPLGHEPGAFRPWMEARLLAQAGFRVTVVTSGVQYMTGRDIRPYRAWCTEEWKDGVRILRTWGPQDYRTSRWKRLSHYVSFATLAGLAALLKVGKVDRVFAGTDPLIMMPVVWLAAVVKKAPLIRDERDLYPETAIALGVIREGAFSRFWFNLQQFFRRQALNILAATPGIRDEIIAYGVPEAKVHLLYNADVFLDRDFCPNRFNTLREEMDRKFLAGYAGGLGSANDVFTLVRAAKFLIKNEEVGIVIAGEGENRAAYMEYCRLHRLDNVFFLGALARGEARNFLREMDVCIQPLHPQRHFSHTLTSKTFDYHGLGKPMVFCGQGDTVQLLAESGGGIAVPSGDAAALAQAIERLWQDEPLRKTIGKSARAWFETHISADRACSLMKRIMG